MHFNRLDRDLTVTCPHFSLHGSADKVDVVARFILDCSASCCLMSCAKAALRHSISGPPYVRLPGSRMSRELHVRFWEGAGVLFPALLDSCGH